MEIFNIVLTSISGILILSTSTPCSYEKKQSTDEPGSTEWVDITYNNHYMNDYNTIVSHAVVKNMLNVPIRNALIVTILKDANGDVLNSATSNAYLIPPGESFPIKAIFKDAHTIEWEKIEVNFSKGKKLDKRAIHTDFQLQNVTLKDDYRSSFIKKVTGTVVNTGDTKAEWVDVFAIFFDKQGRIVASASSGIKASRDIAPGGKGDFSAGTTTAAGDIDRVKVTIIAKCPDWHNFQN